MKNIPFPNPHDADALNDYLDALAAGKQANPVGEVQTTAAALHALANQSLPSIPEAQSGVHTGGETMQIAAYSPPISNRTRRSRTSTPKTSRLEVWLSGILVAGLLISIVGYAWWNGPGGGPDENNNLAWAPQTASPIAEEPFVWTQPISTAECPGNAKPIRYDPENPGGTLYSQEDYDKVSTDRNYKIIGSADPEEATVVVTRMRKSLACSVQAKSFPIFTVRFEYENRTTAGRESLDKQAEQRTQASASVSTWLEADLGLTPLNMAVDQDPGELELDGTEALITQGLYDPDHAVLFADGRIGIILSVVFYSGLPMGLDESTAPGFEPNMYIFENVDGIWMLDEKLTICIGDCSAIDSGNGVGELPSEIPFATPAASPES